MDNCIEKLQLKAEESWIVHALRESCSRCGDTIGRIYTRNGQDTVYCRQCGKFQYNAPFLGSGTVGIVAERLGRRWIGTELSAEYIEVAKRRTRQMGLFATSRVDANGESAAGSIGADGEAEVCAMRLTQSVGYGGLASNGFESLFVPEFVTPGQWCDAHRPGLTPERRLWLAVLEGAIADLNGCGAGANGADYAQHLRTARARRRADEARRWVLGEDAPLSFAAVCEGLGLEPLPLRRRLLGTPVKVPRSMHLVGNQRITAKYERVR